ncbi:hypothetical protein C5Z25_05020 [Lactobacillus sp. CBA3605]|uniref:MFS transporter n=1 Tax=Lactobacillus sp. CBA3605 TaxID=2099788 RepID=UPI000CFD7313|nr:MFS transporter [Lactobacillus sp. CBA3605]AVK61162.1 hypothetical protein C5Z25_05020 [Lactobacillus sp. CBA3605]
MTLFKNRNVMQIVISQLFSGVATWCVTLGIQMIIIFKYNATITGVSALYCAALLPRIILPSFLGTYLDRVKSRVLVVKIGRLFAAVVAFICYFSQGTIQMIILVFVLNAVLSAEEPGMIGVIRNLSDNDDGFDILGIYYMLEDIIKILGPSIAAGISFFTTNKNLFLVATVLFVGSVVLLRVKEATTRHQAKAENKKSLNRFEVVKLIFSQGELLYIFMIVFTFLFSLNAIDTSSGILIRTFTNKSYIQAVFVALMGIGGTIGSLIVLRLINKVNLLTLNQYVYFRTVTLYGSLHHNYC